MVLHTLHLIYIKNALPYVIQPTLLLGNLRTIYVCMFMYMYIMHVYVHTYICIYVNIHIFMYI